MSWKSRSTPTEAADRMPAPRGGLPGPSWRARRRSGGCQPRGLASLSGARARVGEARPQAQRAGQDLERRREESRESRRRARRDSRVGLDRLDVQAGDAVVRHLLQLEVRTLVEAADVGHHLAARRSPTAPGPARRRRGARRGRSSFRRRRSARCRSPPSSRGGAGAPGRRSSARRRCCRARTARAAWRR